MAYLMVASFLLAILVSANALSLPPVVTKTICPKDKPLVQCFVNPCNNAECPAHPDATCVANYCGGCNTNFYLNGQQVEECSVISKISLFRGLPNVAQKPICPKDKPLVQCFVNPCDNAECPAHPDATCVADYCGGCNANFYLNGEIVEQCGIVAKRSLLHDGPLLIETPICPKDKPLVQCKVNPCLTATCPAHQNAKCVADYCGGCYADFYVNDQQVTCDAYETVPAHVTKSQEPDCRDVICPKPKCIFPVTLQGRCCPECPPRKGK